MKVYSIVQNTSQKVCSGVCRFTCIYQNDWLPSTSGESCTRPVCPTCCLGLWWLFLSNLPKHPDDLILWQLPRCTCLGTGSIEASVMRLESTCWNSHRFVACEIEISLVMWSDGTKILLVLQSLPSILGPSRCSSHSHGRLASWNPCTDDADLFFHDMTFKIFACTHRQVLLVRQGLPWLTWILVHGQRQGCSEHRNNHHSFWVFYY